MSQIVVSVRHGHLDESVHQFILQKAEKLSHYFERIAQVTITVDLNEGICRRLEILLNAEHKHDFVAHDDSSDVLTAFDGALEKLKHQLTRYKEKIQDHRRDPSKKVDV